MGPLSLQGEAPNGGLYGIAQADDAECKGQWSEGRTQGNTNV